MTLFYFIRSILFFCSIHLTLVHSLVCSETIYGSPKADDCTNALLEIPYARNSIYTPEARSNHLFTEPQFQNAPFHLVTNKYHPQAIIQIPKIWKHNSCRIALMSQGQRGSSHVASQLLSTRWTTIIDQSEQLRSCFAFNPPRGGWTAIQSLVLYMYDSDSIFNTIMNRYMSEAMPVVPIDNGLELNEPGNATLSPLTLDVIANMTRMLSPSEYKLLDSK